MYVLCTLQGGHEQQLAAAGGDASAVGASLPSAFLTSFSVPASSLLFLFTKYLLILIDTAVPHPFITLQGGLRAAAGGSGR
jgi:hypothetical protein